MLIFLDTEFTDGLHCDLISVGMVSDDGAHEFYAERSDFELDWCNSFVHVAVLPQLGRAGPALDRPQLAVRLIEWFASLPGNSVTVASDSFADWELLLDAIGDERPANLTGWYDLRVDAHAPTFHSAVCHYHSHGHQPWHHALHDAKANRQGWLACYRVTVRLEDCELVASLPDGRRLIHVDPVELANMLLSVGVVANQVHMPDWRDDCAPLTGQKIALLAHMRTNAI